MFVIRKILKKCPCFLVVVILFSGLFLPLKSFSQEGSSRIALTPLTFELTAQRGESVSERIRVMNSSFENNLDVKMEVEDMFPEGEEGRVILEATDEDLDVLAISRWVTFEPEEFTLSPREEKSVKFTINVPRDADAGGHYMGILAGAPPARVEGTGVGIVHRIASLVLLTVPGEMEEELSVVDFNVLQKYYEHGPVTFVSRFENTGTVHLMPDAHITVRDILGREIAVIPVEKRNVLPGAVRKIETAWNADWLFGGFYTAIIEGDYGNFSDKDINSQTVTFFAFPWKVGVVILLITVFFVLTRKRWATIIRILVKGETALSKEED